MKTLSVRAPFWWYILHGGKTVENRKVLTHYRGPLLIHASRFFEEDVIAQDTHSARKIRLALEYPSRAELHAARGMIVGQVDVVDCVGQSDSPWFTGPYGLVLRNSVAFAKPVFAVGQLGYFEVPDDLVREARRAAPAELMGGLFA